MVHQTNSSIHATIGSRKHPPSPVQSQCAECTIFKRRNARSTEELYKGSDVGHLTLHVLALASLAAVREAPSPRRRLSMTRYYIRMQVVLKDLLIQRKMSMLILHLFYSKPWVLQHKSPSSFLSLHREGFNKVRIREGPRKPRAKLAPKP
eukprot:scaffold26_cov397-Pavlova_lutheri.AAC.12